MKNSSTVAKNTIALYFRQILIMLVSLYSVRITLDVLGVEDYGIYNVVAGVVTMFSFLRGAMASASQRYLCFEIGIDNQEETEKIFAITVTIYAILSLVIVIIAETLGLWFVCNKLVIPESRFTAAMWIYQTTVVSFIFTIMTTPYMSSIIAHEDMKIYAYIGIIESLLNLAVCFILKIGKADRLILYAILILAVNIINTLIYRTYCRIHYQECRFRLLIEKDKSKEMFSYVGWNLFGNAVGVFNNQIMNIAINNFFNPVVITARSISSQVNSAVTSFASNFTNAMKPQLIKNYAAGDKDSVDKNVSEGCRISYFLMLVFSIPLILEMYTVLDIWLKEIPDYTVIFTRLALVENLINSLNLQIMTLAQATGRIKLYQSVVGGILLLTFPISFIALKMGAEPYVIYIISIIICLTATVVRLVIVKHLTEFSISHYVKSVYLPCIKVTAVSIVIPIILHYAIYGRFVRLICVVLASVMMTAFSVLSIGITKEERTEVITLIKNKFHK